MAALTVCRQQFDEDVRDLVKVRIIHGFWKRDDERRIHMMVIVPRFRICAFQN